MKTQVKFMRKEKIQQAFVSWFAFIFQWSGKRKRVINMCTPVCHCHEALEDGFSGKQLLLVMLGWVSLWKRYVENWLPHNSLRLFGSTVHYGPRFLVIWYGILCRRRYDKHVARRPFASVAFDNSRVSDIFGVGNVSVATLEVGLTASCCMALQVCSVDWESCWRRDSTRLWVAIVVSHCMQVLVFVVLGILSYSVGVRRAIGWFRLGCAGSVWVIFG